MRKDEVLGELLERLSAMGIEPVGAIDRAPSFVEKRTWQPPSMDTEGGEKDAAGMVFSATIEGAMNSKE